MIAFSVSMKASEHLPALKAQHGCNSTVLIPLWRFYMNRYPDTVVSPHSLNKSSSPSVLCTVTKVGL